VTSLGRRDLLLVDEVQCVPRDGEGMYLSLIDTLRRQAPDLRMVGASATTYRLDSGYLDHGEDALFDKTVFSYSIADGIRDGFLAKLLSKATETKIDVRGVDVRGGEFVAGELEDAASATDIVEGAVNEIIEKGAERRSWLAFCAGVNHALTVRDAIRRHGISCETVVAETPSDERRAIFEAFRRGELRCLTGVNVFSVGFNIPQVDLIAMLRPTLSTGLYVQQVGRGTRKADGKENCLILDFAGNVRRHGPVDAVSVNTQERINPGDVLTKTCPQCREENALAAKTCSCCGHEFVSATERRIGHTRSADNVAILSSEQVWQPVRHCEFYPHQKYGDPLAPPTLRVDHLYGFSAYSEYISFEGSPGARYYAAAWWRAMGGALPVPARVAEAVKRQGELYPVVAITTMRDGRWWRITRRRVRTPDGSIIEIDAKYRSHRVAA
jgi:DNA repair protein RadD